MKMCDERVMLEKKKILIIGSGPAGMFAADELVKQGYGNQAMIIDMGKSMKDRKCPQTKSCSCSVCDILEGEGGSGGFSDGKKTYSLSRGTQMEEIFDPELEFCLDDIDKVIVEHGKDTGYWFTPVEGVPDFLEGSQFEFGSYPLRHIGSDGVRKFIINHSQHLRNEGVLIRTNAQATEIHKTDKGKFSTYVKNAEGYDTVIESDYVILATGLQGSPWVEGWMRDQGISMTSGPAGIGMRLEAPEDVLAPLFDKFYDFKLVMEHDGLTFRSFCCNRNGYIVNENHRTMGVRNVNGHSYINPAKRSRSSNFAIICKVPERHEVCGSSLTPQEFVKTVAWNINGMSGGHPVVQLAEDFVSRQPSTDVGIQNSGAEWTNRMSRSGHDAGSLMPLGLREGFSLFLKELDRVLDGRVFSGGGLIYAPEVKYYGKKANVNFRTWESFDYADLYVAGNASGYLDSFVSAALTGVVTARDIVEKLKEDANNG